MLEWIVTASLLILLVVLLRRLPIAPWQRYALWLVVLLRLLVPVQLYVSPVTVSALLPEERVTFQPSGGLVQPLSPAAGGDVYAAGDNMDGNGGPADAGSSASDGSILTPAPPAPDTADSLRTAIHPGSVLLLCWAAGSGGTALVLLGSNLVFSRRLKRSRRPLEGVGSRLPVYVAEGLPSPCLFGLFRPAIYLTPETAADEISLRHVLAHEETHYRHGDHIWSLLRCLALALHWWNPLVWLAAVLSRRDGELCCDAATLAQLGDGQRRAYGETLLSLVTARPGPRDLLNCSTTMTGGKQGLQERLQWIARQPRVLVSVSVLAVLVALAAVGCAFGQPADESWKTAELMVDQDGVPYRRDAGEAEWTRLGEAIAPPAEWAEQDLAGRNAFTALSGADEYRAALVSATEGWLTATYSRGAAAADTYVYRTEDGGAAWAEVTPPETSWHLSAVGFLSPDRAILAERCFDGAPVHFTADGGVTWGEISLPDGAYEVEAILWDGDTVLLAVSDSLAAESGWLMRSSDLGDTWETEEAASLAEYIESPLSFATVPQSTTADLTHDGTPDALAVTYSEETDIWQLTVTDGATGAQIWSEEAAAPHAGWNALFLCTREGEDCLLRYNPTMYQGLCNYRYEVFWLEDGEPVTADSGWVDFAINPIGGSFDPDAILAFLEKVNGYLTHSVQLMNTDENLLSTFTRLGRLEDDLWWLATWEGCDPEASTGANLSRYAQQLQSSSQLGAQVSEAYTTLSTLPFTAAVEAEDGRQWSYTIQQGNAYNVEFVGGYLPVSFTWSQAGETDWTGQQGYLLTLNNPQSGVSLSARSGGDVVRLETGSTVRYLRAGSSDGGESSEEQRSAIFRHLLIIAEDAAGQAVWDNAVVDSSVTDLETVAAQLTEQIARSYRELPAFLVWKPNDVQVQENAQRVFDAWYGEDPNFCFGMGIYVGITDPMSEQAFHWQVGSGLTEEPDFADYYSWGREVYVALDQEANLWRIRDAGTGGYAVTLPFDMAAAPVSDLVDAWFLSAGFTHDYRLFYYLCDKSLTELADLNEALDQRSREEAEEFLLGFKSHMEEYYSYHKPTLSDIASVLDAPYAAILS